MRFEDFVVNIGDDEEEGTRISLASGQGATLVARAQLARFYKGENFRWPINLSFLATKDYGRLENLGTALYQELFRATALGEELRMALDRVRQSHEMGLRIAIRVEGGLSRPAAYLPWEVLYDPENRGFLALDPMTPIVRLIRARQGVSYPRISGRLQVLLVCADGPHGLVGLETEREGILAALAGSFAAEVSVLQNPGPDELTNILLRRPFHVFHYMGHAALDGATGQASLILGDRAGGLCHFPAERLALLAREQTDLRLVFLNASDTAAPPTLGAPRPFGGLATSLIAVGVAAVVGMQGSVSDTAAVRFSSAFYRRIAASASLEEAISEGRRALQAAASPEWATPVLFTSNGARLFEREPDVPGKPRGRRLKLFLCHSKRDRGTVVELYRRLQTDGFEPWLDEEDLLAGVRWRQAVLQALRTSDVILVCLSRQALAGQGFRHKEIREALELTEQRPSSVVSLVPVRLEECDLPQELGDFHYIDLFRENGYAKLLKTLVVRLEQLESEP